MNYIDFLRRVHEVLAPQRYLEIGIRTGTSMAVSRCRTVGIDPDYHIEAELAADVRLFCTTSDEYFARPDPLAPTDGQPFDLAFIDGLHLFEFALRDFINTERHSTAGSLIVFDDMLPRRVEEAARDRHTRAWTGDLYPILDVLAEYRPDLATVLVDTQPTGLLLVLGLDPDNRVLTERYDEIVARFRHRDPQPVPAHLLDRSAVQDPHRVLRAGFLEVLASHQGREATPDLHQRLRDQLVDNLGPVYAPA